MGGADYNGRSRSTFVKQLHIKSAPSAEGMVLTLEGPLTVETVPGLLAAARRDPVVLDLAGVSRADSAGLASLVQLVLDRRAVAFQRVPPEIESGFRLLRGNEVLRGRGAPDAGPAPPLERLGGWALARRDQAVSFLNLMADALGSCARRRRSPRGTLLREIVRSGPGSVTIVVLISFIVGLILALQSAVALRKFGATRYVADLVGISMTREMGPLITAILLAGRIGSAWAAEIGSMAVSEELDAMKVMGMDPRRHLVLPRFLALAATLPCLTVLADVAGIAGGFLIGTTVLDLAPATYLDETLRSVLLRDLGTGLLKSVVFATLIAIIGCDQGFRVRRGAEGVGRATTTAVVASVLAIVAADGLFTAVFFLLR